MVLSVQYEAVSTFLVSWMLSLYGGSLGLREPLGRLTRLPTSPPGAPSQLPLRSHRKIAEGFPPAGRRRSLHLRAAGGAAGPPLATEGRTRG